MQGPELKIKIRLWKRLIKQLKTRGDQTRESGAFLLGKPYEREISDFICYDELDPASLNSGIIIFNGDGYIPLWEICRKKKLKVLADVHTHPGNWTGQSGPDQRHPMIAQPGHIALIVPDFAAKRNQLLENVGVHEFLGEGSWRSYGEKERIIQLIK